MISSIMPIGKYVHIPNIIIYGTYVVVNLELLMLMIFIPLNFHKHKRIKPNKGIMSVQTIPVLLSLQSLKVIELPTAWAVREKTTWIASDSNAMKAIHTNKIPITLSI